MYLEKGAAIVMKWMNSFTEKLSSISNPNLRNIIPFDPAKSPESLLSLVKNHPDVVCLFNHRGDIVTHNHGLSTLIGFQDNEIPPHLFSDLFRPFDLGQGLKGNAQTHDLALTHKEGHLVDVQIIHIPILSDDSIAGVLCVIKDTTENVKTAKTFLRAITKTRDIINHLDIAIWAIDPQKQQFIFCSNAFQDIYDTDMKLSFENWQSFVHPDDLKDVIEQHKRLSKGESLHHRYRILTPKGAVKWVKDHTIPVKDTNGTVVRLIGFTEDITETKALEQRLEKMAYYDELTGLPNRYYGRKLIRQWINQHKQENKTFALCYLNLDGINRINDTVGHEVGDEALKKMAQRISDVIQKNDSVFRIEGDEFIVLIPHQEKIDDYRQVAQKLIDLTEQPLHIEGYDIYITMSIGISLFSLDSNDYSTITRNARIAMKRAKGFGKNTYQIYASHMDIESFKLFQLESDLRNAITNHEFFMEYQPRIDVKTQRALGAEALIRWNHPTWGTVSPAEFIPLAEENSKTIEQMSQFVVESVCKQIKNWQNQSVELTYISLNLSAKNFLRDDFVNQIKGYLDLYQINPTLIEIEVTEGVLLQSTEVVKSQLDRIKELGMRIALDDFGTGYSSISYLKKYPVDTIKIDRSFIQNLTEDEEDQVIVKSTIDLAKGLKKNVVAEGIETREQYEFLKKYGCDEIQGYLFSKPVSGEAMAKIFLQKTIPLIKRNPSPPVERRRYYRVNLPLSLSANMTILSINGKNLALGSTEVLVQDISLGGLQIMSHLRLIPNPNIVYGFTMIILENKFQLRGKVVWDHEVKINVFEYGIEFIIEESDRDKLASVLNRLSSKLRNNPSFNDSHFITEDALEYMIKYGQEHSIES